MIPQEMSLEGKAAIVSGDGTGWFRYLALALGEAGADVAIAAPAPQQVEAAAEEVRHMGRRAVAIATDMASAAEAEAMAEKAVASLGKVDILVNSANLFMAKPFLEVREEELSRLMEANLVSLFRCCRAVGRHMVEQKKGRIINITSGLSQRGLANCVAYCASQGAVLQFTRALAIEWAAHGIRVNAIGAGWITAGEASEQNMARDPLARYIPLRRWGHPSELGGVLVWLASDISDYVTGQVYFVDGGVLAHA